ncbi:MAG: alpha/beta fold hydrolase [Synechococcaceae cyanobacterium]|nr:alpha/beta fold hydrolase [Synechococcaceae cyanobacterium]
MGLHGWLLSGRVWQPLGSALAPRWQFVAPDLPGFGGTPRPRGLGTNLASYGRWLAGWVRRQAGERPVVLLGHSLGGSVALHAAPHLEGQVLGLVQIAAGGGLYQPRPFARVRRGGAAFLQWRPAWLASVPGMDRFRSPLVAELRAARGLLACSTNRGAVRQLPWLTATLPVPSLWIAGGRARVMEPRYVRHLAGYSPLHRLEVLEEAGHLPMRQMPGALSRLVEDWLLEEVVGSQAPGVGRIVRRKPLPAA